MGARPDHPLAFPAVLTVVAALSALAAVFSWTRPGDPALLGAAPDRTVEVVVLDNGFHTDMAVRRDDLRADGGPLGLALDAVGPGDWILVGWGDARFYVDQSPISDRLPDGARAFFRPGNASVVMLDPTWAPPGGDRRVLRLSPAAFAAMRARIEDSLALENGRPRIAAARPGDDARFFASRETFSILHLCNHWTGELLSTAGLAVKPLGVTTSSGVIAAIDGAELDRPGSGA